jgi:hypothetical protein
MNSRSLGAIGLVAIVVPAVRAQLPSQRELNGFLIGQHRDAIAASFATLMQADTTRDGWIDRVYLVDRTHHAYMAFKFPHDRTDFTISVQIAGDSGTPMVPFLGLLLGDHRDVLVARLGRPSHIEHEADLNLDLYQYAHRNYSVEVDAQGRVSSIQIFAYDGFPDAPRGAAPSLDSLAHALQAGGDIALQYLMPDVEVYRAGKTIGFEHAALTDLLSDTTEISKALFKGPASIAAALRDSSFRAAADVNLRVWEHGGVGWVSKFPAPAPIEELVWKADAGRWRVWEVRYR